MADIVERLRTRPTGDPYLHMMVHEAANEIERLRGERGVLAGWIRQALLCLETIDPDEQEDGGEHHRMFMNCGERLVTPNV